MTLMSHKGYVGDAQDHHRFEWRTDLLQVDPNFKCSDETDKKSAAAKYYLGSYYSGLQQFLEGRKNRTEAFKIELAKLPADERAQQEKNFFLEVRSSSWSSMG